jgi:phosphatidate cytidylyltransferase
MLNQNLRLRIVSALILGSLFIASILFSKWLYYLVIVIVGILMGYEWYNITKQTKYLKYGYVIIPLPILCLIALRHTHDNYIFSLLYFCSIWTVDTFAMIGGKSIGGPKLAPIISPNKTWSGLITGCLFSGIICHIMGRVFIIQNFPINFFIYGFLNGIVSQMSDIFISYFKRKCHVKDSGSLIPGHGGVLDRFDSTIFSAPMLLCLMFFK